MKKGRGGSGDADAAVNAASVHAKIERNLLEETVICLSAKK
jgi:hypothetical protein